MSRIPPMEYLRTFECVARHGNFTQAATELNRTQASVSQHIKALETFLGRPLFFRQRRGVALTELGRAYLPSVQAAIDGLGMATSTLFGSKTARKLVLSAPVALHTNLLIPALRDFRASHPDVSFNFTSTIWSDPAFDETVLYGQFGDGRWEGMHARQITWCRLVPVCAPGYAWKGEKLSEPWQLLDVPLISVVAFTDAWTRWFEAAGVDVQGQITWVNTDNSLTAMQMAQSEYGVALVPHMYSAQPLREGKLVVPFNINIAAGGNHYLLTPRKLFQRDELYREFVDYVVAAAAAREKSTFRIGLQEKP